MTEIDLNPLLEYLKARRQSELQLAKLVYQISQVMDYNQLAELLESRGHKEAIKKTQWNNYVRIYKYWILEAGYNLEELEPYGMTKLYTIAVNQLPTAEAAHWLERARKLSSRKLLEEIKEAVRQKPLREPFKTIRLPESVHAQFEQSLARLRSIVHESKISPIAYIEWISEFVNNAPAEAVKEIWMALHGAPEIEHKIDYE